MKKVSKIITLAAGLGILMFSCSNPSSGGGNNTPISPVYEPIRQQKTFSEIISSENKTTLKAVWNVTSGSGTKTVNGIPVYLDKDDALIYAEKFINNAKIDLSSDEVFDENSKFLKFLDGSTYTNTDNPQEVKLLKSAGNLPGDFKYFKGKATLNPERTILTINITFTNSGSSESVNVSFVLKKEGSTNTSEAKDSLEKVVERDGNSWLIGNWKIIELSGVSIQDGIITPVTTETVSSTQGAGDFNKPIYFSDSDIATAVLKDEVKVFSSEELKKLSMGNENMYSISRYVTTSAYKVSDDKTVIVQNVNCEMELKYSEVFSKLMRKPSQVIQINLQIKYQKQ